MHSKGHSNVLGISKPHQDKKYFESFFEKIIKIAKNNNIFIILNSIQVISEDDYKSTSTIALNTKIV